MNTESSPQIILVTGGAGFIGSHLLRALSVRYPHSKLISLDNYFTGSKENHIEGVEYREGHTKDIESLVPESPELVFHLGEYARVAPSFKEPRVVWDLNIRGTFGVLEFIRARGSKLIYAGSSTKYGDGGLGRSQSPYAWSKANNTELIVNYGEWYNIRYAITYFYNVYGPGERTTEKYGTVIATFLEKYKAGEPLPLWRPGTQERYFTHVEDIVSGLLLVSANGEGDEFGLGDDTVYTMEEVAKLFGGPIEYLPEHPGERKTATLDASRARALGWECKWKLVDYINAEKNTT